jgi:hypothetical protein
MNTTKLTAQQSLLNKITKAFYDDVFDLELDCEESFTEILAEIQ